MNPLQSPQAILIDLDGTLLDTKKAIEASLEHALHFIGLDTEHDRHVQDLMFQVMSVGASLSQAAKKFWGTLDISPDINPHEVVAQYREHYAKVAQKLTTPFPGVCESLQQLSRTKIPLCVVTNKGEKDALTALNDAHITQYFSHIITDRPGVIAKPDPQSYQEILAPALGYPDPQRVIMIGDTATDIAYAHAAGIQSCWAQYGYGASDIAQKCSPHYIASTPQQWCDIIMGSCTYL